MDARLDSLENPIVMACPGSDCPGNRSDGRVASCQYCNGRFALVGDVIGWHETADIIAMIDRGDFAPRSTFNRSR